MLPPGLSRFLVAYALGSPCGMLALALEVFPKGDLATPEAFAAYGLAGGMLAGVGRAVLSWLVWPQAARAGVILVIGAFLALHLLYFANVRILPGDPYSSPKSIVLDLVVLAAVATPLFWLSRSPWSHAARYHFDRELTLAGAGLLFAQGLLLAFAWPAGTVLPARRGQGPNLLLVVIDSVRRDHLSLHAYPQHTSPALDVLGNQGRVYESAYSASSWTVPSVAWLLRSSVARQRLEDLTLAGRLARHGYLTACFTDNPHLTPESDILIDFDRVSRSVGAWRWMFRKTVLGEVVERLDGGSDRALVDRAVAWMNAVPGPFFVYVHMMDSHTPYSHRPIDGRRYTGRRIEFPYSRMPMSAEEAKSIVARYDGGIQSADVQLGRLVAAAARLGRPFVGIITSDHGESLGESGRWFHGGSLAPELLAVPLLVIGEGVLPGRVSRPVSSLSISRTFLSAADVPCPQCRGSDLRTSSGDGFAEGGLPPDLLYRIGAGFKLVVNLRTKERQLFDLRNDPTETKDIERERPRVATTLAKGLARFEQADPPTPDDVERLRSLGYAGY